jgi:hypothetical protein
MAQGTVPIHISIDPSSTPPFVVLANQMPRGQEGVPYPPTPIVSMTGGVPPYRVTVTALPAGLVVDEQGIVSGTPTFAGIVGGTATGADSGP